MRNIVKIIKTEKWDGGCQGLGGRELLFNGQRVSVLQNEEFWR